MSEKIKLKDLFSGLQKQIEARFSTNRKFIKHSGSKGDSLENVWIDWLREYLPNRYCVDKAFVIDSKGQLSHQLDLVIYDQHFTPFVFKQDGISYIPVEGVYAVFEVKPDIKGSVKVKNESISYIKYAGRKIASVRKLHRTSTSIIDRGHKHPPRPLTKIIGGLLAVESNMSHKTVEKQLKSLKPLETFDMGCAVAAGSFYLNYEGKESPPPNDLNRIVKGLFEQNKFKEIEQLLEKRISDYYDTRSIQEIEFSQPEHSLVTFFLQLSRYLQQSIGSVAAIDLGAYAKAVKFEIDEEL
jgi:Domain of unknown function (DUF6602)